jgi:hypothetical protein
MEKLNTETGEHSGGSPCSHLSEPSLRWVLDQIRVRQRQIREEQDHYTAATALLDAAAMRERHNELEGIADKINQARYALNNPNAGHHLQPESEGKGC